MPAAGPLIEPVADRIGFGGPQPLVLRSSRRQGTGLAYGAFGPKIIENGGQAPQPPRRPLLRSEKMASTAFGPLGLLRKLAPILGGRPPRPPLLGAGPQAPNKAFHQIIMTLELLARWLRHLKAQLMPSAGPGGGPPGPPKCHTGYRKWCSHNHTSPAQSNPLVLLPNRKL